MNRQTPLLAIYLAGLTALAVILLFEVPERPLDISGAIIIFAVAFLPALGFALLFDPVSRKAKEKYLKRNFYSEAEHKIYGEEKKQQEETATCR